MRKQVKLIGMIALIAVMLVVAIVPAVASNSAPATDPDRAQLPAVDLLMWSKESPEFMEAIGFQAAFDTWAAENAPGATLTIETKDVEQLRTDLQQAALAGEGIPDMLWTVADHAGPFTEAGLIQPLDELFDMEPYLNTVLLNGQIWGIPFSAGNHLMLIYNKEYVAEPPATMEDLVALAEELKTTYADVEGFVPFTFSHEESFWVFPWMQAINPDGVPFVGFAEDGVTPDLNNEAVIKTFEMLKGLKDSGVTAQECNYDCLNGFFMEGKSAMTINGDWSLGGDAGMIAALGENLGLAPWPMFEGGQPRPLIGGAYAMVPAATAGDKLDVVTAFLTWYTTDVEQVITYTVDQGRLPGLLAAFDDPAVQDDPTLAMSASALATGVPQPVNTEMRCLFDAITQEYRAVMGGTSEPAASAENAQAFAESCIADLQ